jgi:large subunit ribosomal protein L23
MKGSIYNVLKRPLVTEKSSALKAEANKIVFEIHKDANKIDVKNAVQTLFDVTVTDVHTMIQRGKPKRVGRSIGMRKSWKKAVVTLAEGTDLDVFGNLEVPEVPDEEE